MISRATLQTEFEEDFGIQFGKVEKIAFAKLVRRAATTERKARLGQDESGKIWDELVASGYLNASGDILGKFDPKNPHFELKVSDGIADLKAAIIDEINRKVFKNRIVNARERRELKFRKEVQLRADFQALWEKIKHRTRYRVSIRDIQAYRQSARPHQTDRAHQGAPRRDDGGRGGHLRSRRIGR